MLAEACSPKVNNGGYVNENDIKNQIVIGKTTKDDVKEAFGSPSAESSFGAESWYYISDRKEAYAFLKPTVVEQNVVRIEFDPTGVASTVESYSKKDGEEFDLAKRTTPTEGHTLGFFEQILGNIGRFNRPGSDSSAPGRKPSS